MGSSGSPSFAKMKTQKRQSSRPEAPRKPPFCENSNINEGHLQDDLFDSVVVSDMQFAKNGNMEVNVKIKTKYDYQTEKKVVI